MNLYHVICNHDVVFDINKTLIIYTDTSFIKYDKLSYTILHILYIDNVIELEIFNITLEVSNNYDELFGIYIILNMIFNNIH